MREVKGSGRRGVADVRRGLMKDMQGERVRDRD